MIPFLSFFFNSCFLHLLLARSSSPWRLLCFLLLGKRIYPSYCVVFISYITAQIVWTYRPSTITSTETSFLFRLVHGALWQPTSGNVDNQQQQVPPPPFANSIEFFLFPFILSSAFVFSSPYFLVSFTRISPTNKMNDGKSSPISLSVRPPILPFLFHNIISLFCLVSLYCWYQWPHKVSERDKEWTRGEKSIKENLEHVL